MGDPSGSPLQELSNSILERGQRLRELVGELRNQQEELVETGTVFVQVPHSCLLVAWTRTQFFF